MVKVGRFSVLHLSLFPVFSVSSLTFGFYSVFCDDDDDDDDEVDWRKEQVLFNKFSFHIYTAAKVQNSRCFYIHLSSARVCVCVCVCV